MPCGFRWLLRPLACALASHTKFTAGPIGLTPHRGVRQIVDLHSVLEMIREDRGRWIKSQVSLLAEHEHEQRRRAGPREKSQTKDKRARRRSI